MNHADSEQVPSCHGVRRIHAIHDKKRTVYDKNGTFFLCVLTSYCKRRYDCLCGQTKELDPDQI